MLLLSYICITRKNEYIVREQENGEATENQEAGEESTSKECDEDEKMEEDTKEEKKVALALKVLRHTDPEADHRKNADSIVASIVNHLDVIGIGFPPDFSFFTVQYVSS